VIFDSYATVNAQRRYVSERTAAQLQGLPARVCRAILPSCGLSMPSMKTAFFGQYPTCRSDRVSV